MFNLHVAGENSRHLPSADFVKQCEKELKEDLEAAEKRRKAKFDKQLKHVNKGALELWKLAAEIEKNLKNLKKQTIKHD